LIELLRGEPTRGTLLAKRTEAGERLARTDPLRPYDSRSRVQMHESIARARPFRSRPSRLMDAEDDEAVRLLREARVHIRRLRNHTGEPTFAQFSDGYWTPWHIANEALQRAALPQQQAEPVAWLYDVWEHVGGKARVQFAAIDWSPAPGDTRVLIKKVPLYAAPPAADEAVRLLREAYELEHWTLTPKLREAIGAYLAKVKC
jgi:hypothetical protein